MSFQNSYGPDGSININVIPSFGHVVMLPEQEKNMTVQFCLCSWHKSINGELWEEFWDKDLLTLIPQGMHLSAQMKLSKTLSIKNTSTNMWRDRDLAEDSDSDTLNLIFTPYPTPPLLYYSKNLNTDNFFMTLFWIWSI